MCKSRDIRLQVRRSRQSFRFDCCEQTRFGSTPDLPANLLYRIPPLRQLDKAVSHTITVETPPSTLKVGVGQPEQLKTTKY